MGHLLEDKAGSLGIRLPCHELVHPFLQRAFPEATDVPTCYLED